MKVEDMEEFWTKVKASLIKVDLLEAENQRLKETTGRLKESIGRLKKYNGELRHALIKEQAQEGQQVIQILDDGGDGDSQLFNSKSVEEVSQTLQSFDVVVFDPNIMDLVFKNLDVKNIKKCRLGCQNWKETVSRILSRKNGGYGLAVRLQEGKLKGMTDAFQRHNIIGLRSIIASAPQHWFSKALLDKSFTRKTEIQSVLLDFGYCLRSIEITGNYFLFQDVHKILVDWCPNLEQLGLPPHLTVDVEEIVPRGIYMKEVYQQLVFNRPLKLTGLFMQAQIYYPAVKASPNLKTISLRFDSNKYSLQFFKELLHCPDVMRNLEAVSMYIGSTGGYLTVSRMNQIMEVFNSLQFSTRLKKLGIQVAGKFRAKKLSEALKKLGGTLEKLVIIIDNGMDPEFVFPGMNNLTELRYLTDSTMLINSMEFLTDMPNITTLYLGENGFNIDGEENFIDNLFSDCEQLRKHPRTKVKELYLFGVVQSPSPTFEMINTIFPNLTKLVVGIGMFVLDDSNVWEELRNYYTAVLDGALSEMPNLKDLYLDFSRLDLDDEGEFDYMAFVFSQLNKLSNLTYLTIRDNSNSTTALVGDKLLEMPNLRQITLIGLKLERLVAKELTMLLYRHDIQLEIRGEEFREDFRMHLEESLTLRRRNLTVS